MVKPLIDLLAVFEIPWKDSKYDLIVKGGIAYRQWQLIDRCTKLSRVDGEIQTGAGYHPIPNARIDLLYQGIFGGSPHFKSDIISDECSVSNIPIQQGVLLTFTYFL